MNTLQVGANYDRTCFTSKSKMAQIKLKMLKDLALKNGCAVTAYRPGEVRLIVGETTKTFFGKTSLQGAYKYLSTFVKKGRI